MAVECNVYGQGVQAIVERDIDLTSDTIKVALFNDSHSFSEAHATWANVKANQITGTNYNHAAGGLPITHGVADEVQYAAGIVSFGKDAEDSEWTNSTITAHHAVVYQYIDDTGAPDDASRLLCSIDFDGAEISADGDFTIEWHADGIFRFVVNP